MNWRGVHISEAAKLRLHKGRLHIAQEGPPEREHSLPLEDMAFIVLESRQVNLSSALLSSCAEQGVMVLFCDEKHLPCGALLPYNQHYRQGETAKAQIGLSLPRQKRLWQEIICHKIRNQATCLHRLGRGNESVRKVAILAQKVKSGDSGNVEAQAARLYWSIYSKNFSREAEAEDRLNSMLNYGYAVVRSSLAAELSALGFITCLGLRHCSMQNAYNLADDLIEPWRPFVDILTMRRFMDAPQEEFSLADRQTMCGILHDNVLFEDGEQQLLASLRRQAAMLKNWTLGKRNSLEYPDFCVTGKNTCQPME